MTVPLATTGSTKHPDPFLSVRVRRLELSPTLRGVCAGFESELWRESQLAQHLIEWLPEFALDFSELRELGPHNAVPMLRKAARVIYTSEKYQKRGEFGEILLHALIRQECKSEAAISKVYFKTAVNDTVKGFDAVHVCAQTDGLELWLGEAKFYNDLRGAVREVLVELQDHLAADYLRTEFLLIENKIDNEWEHAPALKALLHRNTSLDSIFKRLCIPIMLTYDSACIDRHKALDEAYIADFVAEVNQAHALLESGLRDKSVPADVRLHLFVVPVRSKADLVKLLDQELKKWQ